LLPSSDYFRSSHAALGARHYYQATAHVAEVLAAYFKIAFPLEYETYRKAFEAGVWYQEDPGPWLGRAIVYKLQVNIHQDGNDGGPTAIFNVGQYVGGKLYLPDLRVKLE
jgi:hypothetical protein